MNTEIIKSFLVGLGFGVDDSSLAKFNKAIASASLRVTALYASIKIAAAGIFWSISKISEGFEQMGYEYRIISPMINKTLMMRQALLSAYRAAGINITKVVQQSVLFNFSLAKTKFAFEAIYKSVGVKFLPLLTKQMDIFRGKIYANMPKIQESLMKFVNFIFKAFEATAQLGNRVWSILGRVWDFFKKLDEVTDGWSTRILGAIAVWKLLNLSFMATPLGMIITGLTAILALWDDFMTFKEGGESFINWSSQTTKVIVGLTAAVGAMAAVWGTAKIAIGGFSAALQIYRAIQAGVNVVMMANPIGLIIAGVTALVGLLTWLDAKWQIFGGHLSGFFSGVGGKIMDLLGGGGASTNTAAVTQPQPPLIGQQAGTNQKVSQETNILVQGSADANATGRAVAAEQGKVNFDLARNLKGATR